MAARNRTFSVCYFLLRVAAGSLSAKAFRRIAFAATVLAEVIDPHRVPTSIEKILAGMAATAEAVINATRGLLLFSIVHHELCLQLAHARPSPTGHGIKDKFGPMHVHFEEVDDGVDLISPKPVKRS